jgi:hypothetical protein
MGGISFLAPHHMEIALDHHGVVGMLAQRVPRGDAPRRSMSGASVQARCRPSGSPPAASTTENAVGLKQRLGRAGDDAPVLEQGTGCTGARAGSPSARR